MTPGSEPARRFARSLASLGLLVVLATATGCPSRRAVSPEPPLPTAERPTSTPPQTPTATPDVGPPSLAPPEIVASLPANPPTHLATAARMAERARRDLEAGEVDRALELLEQALQVDPTAPFAYYYMAGGYLLRGRAAEALVLAERAAALSTGYPAGWAGHSHVLRGRALEALARPDQAIGAYRAAIAADPGNAPAREALARLAPR